MAKAMRSGVEGWQAFVRVAPFLLGAFRWLSLFWSVEFGFSFSWLEVDLSFFGWELVLSFFLLGGCSSSGVMVGPSF